MVRPVSTSLLFPNARGTVYSKSGFRSVFLPALLEAGLAHRNKMRKIVADFHFHELRHTAISLMCRAGMKPELIALRVGHSDGGALIYRRYPAPVPVGTACRSWPRRRPDVVGEWSRGGRAYHLTGSRPHG